MDRYEQLIAEEESKNRNDRRTSPDKELEIHNEDVPEVDPQDDSTNIPKAGFSTAKVRSTSRPAMKP